MLPGFVTFTGVDERTDVERLKDLAEQYSVEYAVLFSEARQGEENRYPKMDVIEKFVSSIGAIPISAHLCGKYARRVMDGDFDLNLPVLESFDRIQVNHTKPDFPMLANFAHQMECEVIAQWRDAQSFDAASGVSLLFDPSGGNGRMSDTWPQNHHLQIVGYSGGLSPENVQDMNRRANSPEGYWLDMESGVRTDDWFDLDKIEAVLRAVYGS